LNITSKFFDTVELNVTFYRLPAVKTVERWRDSVPPGFLFSVKGSRYITHVKRLKEAGDAVITFVESVSSLGDKLGPILFQLPAVLKPDLGRFDSFLGCLPTGYRYVFEFRNPAWLIPEVYRMLAGKGMGLHIRLWRKAFPGRGDFRYGLYTPSWATSSIHGQV
jgi:uncharacterized protein YecE (DUF72 family)